MLSDLSKVTQLPSGRTDIETQALSSPALSHLSPQPLVLEAGGG